jgi:carboxyl-terminal processing protease
MAYVNGQNVSRASERELRSKITGSDGTTISIKVIRDGQRVDLNVERSEKEALTVHDRMLPNGVLYLKVDSMDNEAQPEQLRAAIERHPDAKSYVLDLRDNVGGLLNSSLKMASLFVEKGNLLTVSRRVDSDPENPQYSRKNYVLTPDGISVTSSLDPGVRPDSQMARFQKIVDKPVAILVNEKTASSAEILAAALRENGAGTIVGETTYGKGIGQTIFSGMPGGSSLKLTTFRFLSPQGHWFGDGNATRQGIQPDIKIKNVPDVTSGTSSDLQLSAARQFLQSKRK